MCFLYSLALQWDVDVPQLELTSESAQAAFTLQQVYRADNNNIPNNSPLGMDLDPQEVAELTPTAPAALQLRFDEKVVPLPPVLAAVWHEVQAGTRKTDLKTLLEDLPRFEPLPKQPRVNNHAQDYKRQEDQKDRNYQSKVLHIMRVMAYTHNELQQEGHEEEAEDYFVQVWQMLAELYTLMERERKSRSIPGSVVQAEGLFDKEDLAQAQWQQRLKGFRGMSRDSPLESPHYSFRSNSAYPSGKGGRGPSGKGFRAFKSGYKPYGQASRGSGAFKGGAGQRRLSAIQDVFFVQFGAAVGCGRYPAGVDFGVCPGGVYAAASIPC
jgi:hypothetical protein